MRAFRRPGLSGSSRCKSWVLVNEPIRQPVYVFEGFHLDAHRRGCLAPDGQPITLTPRLFDALLYFVERPGSLLSKEHLLEALWPDLVVEEHNLNKTVSELRRVLARSRASTNSSSRSRGAVTGSSRTSPSRRHRLPRAFDSTPLRARLPPRLCRRSAAQTRHWVCHAGAATPCR